MRLTSLVSSPFVRKMIGSVFSVLVNDLYSLRYSGEQGKGHAHDVAGHALIMNLLARYGIGCDPEFAEYSIIRVIQVIKTMSERR